MITGDFKTRTMTPRDPNTQEGGVPPAKKEKESRELTEDEITLLTKFKTGEIGFDAIQREIATRAFEKILVDPSSVKVKDWLTSELVKIKKEESQVKIGAMEAFVRKLFSGNLPTHCQKCGSALFQEGVVINHEQSSDHSALLA